MLISGLGQLTLTIASLFGRAQTKLQLLIFLNCVSWKILGQLHYIINKYSGWNKKESFHTQLLVKRMEEKMEKEKPAVVHLVIE